ncbi:MAG TPA: transcription-repair coupling factor [Thermoanaerobaculia bacterium]|nr:transcription-repair coupling factor [Thermoanaerobaculia bacterium]
MRLPLAAAAWVAELVGEALGRPVLALVPGEADALAWLEAAELFGDPRRGPILYFPAPSLSPYHEAETSLLVRAQEALALDAVARGRARAVVATPRSLFRLLPEPEGFLSLGLDLEPGRDLAMDELVERLIAAGYHRADLVSEVGELAVRGGVFDLFPPGEELPIRLDFFGDTIEAIRAFDPTTQRSQDSLERVRVLPLCPFPAGPEAAARLAARLARELPRDADGELAEHLAQLAGHGSFPGWENLLPWLEGAEHGLADLLEDPLVWAVDPATLEAETRHHAELLAGEYAGRRSQGRPALPPDLLEAPLERVLAVLAGAEVALSDLISRSDTGALDFGGTPTDVFHAQLPRFPNEVAASRARQERTVVVVAPRDRERMVELLEGREIPIGRDGAELVTGELSRGFRLPPAGVAVYGEGQLLARRMAIRAASKARFGPFLPSLRDLKVGDYVVHVDHGIAQFVGLRSVGGDPEARKRLPPELAAMFPIEAPTEVMELAYSGGKRLLVPLARLDLIQKFSGIEGVAPRLDQLGGTSWNKTKSRVKKSLRDMAEELVKLYAERQLARAPRMGPDTDLERQMEAAFAWDETPDQLDAIAAIKKDLEGERPMDRLLCGDVGYGKTEVAMRAAFKVVDNGHQVAVLAPTTILADQHLETFKKRFDGLPVTIEMVSRFRSPAEVKELGRRLRDGKVDILIGTHRLLSRDIELPRLGLLIVDEEQRFGVAQKERLKQLKKNVHVLAMSATPVPRTLQLSLAGVRDLSVIETPPKNRMAVETAIVPFSRDLIREAIELELERGGQVYYVYNRVESIEVMLAELKEIVPGARITVGHGQLPEEELSRRMHAFTEGRFDILLASTIIENGIDIPNVNTMIVHRADRFGLSQLYQLRGRVGRSDQLAYCYLLVERDVVLSETARKRLAAIREFTDLGAGFRIAARDLEIRGAGNLLGAEQSGHINDVGLETYLKMLEETVAELKGERAPEDGPSTAIDLPVPMSIPHDYIADANLRMEIYRKIAAAESGPQELAAELADRFGDPPAAVHTLLAVAELKRLAERLRVQSISAKKGELILRMRRDAAIDVDRLIAFVSDRPGTSFSPSGVLSVAVAPGESLLGAARGVLEHLGAPAGLAVPT